MEYTVQGLAKLAGITGRTIRYYDEQGLLKPARINSSGYRIYGPAEIDLLQQILFYRELGFSLQQIKKIITDENFDKTQALKEHRERLLAKREQLDELINTVEKSIAQAEGKGIMSDQEKFEGFTKRLIEENEAKYGKEVREKYGDETVDQSNTKLLKMTEAEYAELTDLDRQIKELLEQAMNEGAAPSSELGQKIADLHRQWICYYWPTYSKEAHAGLAEMYVADPRFTAYYDQKQPGTANFLKEAILCYTGKAK